MVGQKMCVRLVTDLFSSREALVIGVRDSSFLVFKFRILEKQELNKNSSDSF